MSLDLETQTEFETDIEIAGVDTAVEVNDTVVEVNDTVVEESDTLVEENDIDEFDNSEFIDNSFNIATVDPEDSTNAKPGSDDKVLMLAARYAAGLPLWHNNDCYDHGPGLQHLLGLES